MKKNIAVLIVLFIVACATPYQKIGDTGGFYHLRMDENVFKIGFRGNGFTTYERANDFALLRAAEICKQLGYTHFVLEGQQDRSRTTEVDMGSTSYTSGSVYGYGDTASYYGTTNTYSNTMPVKKPGVELFVRYFDGKPEGRYLEIYEANSVINNLRTKYSLNKPQK